MVLLFCWIDSKIENDLQPFSKQTLVFTCLQYKCFENIVEKGEIARTSLLKTLWKKEKIARKEQFLFSHSVFYPCGELSAIFIELEIVVGKLCQLGIV